MHVKKIGLQVEGIDIRGQLFLPDKPPAHQTVCICHGIPAHIPDPAERGYAELAERVCGEGLAAFIFNFRGCGLSGGNLDMPGWTRDLSAVIDYLSEAPEVERTGLSLLGFSGGAAVSVYVAARDRRISSVAACACPAQFSQFTRTEDIPSLLGHFRDIGVFRDNDFPPSVTEWLDGFNWIRPVDYIAAISPRPLLLVHGDADEVVDVGQAQTLYARAGEPKELVIISGAGHRLRQDASAMKTVIGWLKRHWP